MAPKPMVGASIAIIRDQTVLLVLRGRPPYQGAWSLPGGRIEPGETAEQCAIRELFEETGITGAITAPLTTREIHHNGALWLHLTVFQGVALGGQPRASDDAAAVGWYRLEAIAGLTTTPDLVEIISPAFI